jgi:toxin HigB-1
MIKNFSHKGLKRFFVNNDKSLLSAKDCFRISRILDRLDASMNIIDMDLPGFNLHKLLGEKKNFWSVKVSSNWRVTFRFENGDVYDVDLEDYH